jgi:RimJ/RimL family protein N-acetyltransferase
MTDLADWTPRAAPERITLSGRYVELRPLTSAHYADLFAATGGPEDADLWTYLPAVAPTALSSFWMTMAALVDSDPTTYTIVPTEGERAGKPSGVFSLLRAEPAQGSVEIGWVLFGRALQRTRAATEAIHLLQDYCLGELGYRRLEWKCDSENEPSRRAAARFGFTYEGRFRQHRVVKGRNRDTDWFSIVDGEWPALRTAHEQWLDPANFDARGEQIKALKEFTSWDPSAHMLG